MLSCGTMQRDCRDWPAHGTEKDYMEPMVEAPVDVAHRVRLGSESGMAVDYIKTIEN